MRQVEKLEVAEPAAKRTKAQQVCIEEARFLFALPFRSNGPGQVPRKLLLLDDVTHIARDRQAKKFLGHGYDSHCQARNRQLKRAFGCRSQAHQYSSSSHKPNMCSLFGHAYASWDKFKHCLDSGTIEDAFTALQRTRHDMRVV